MTTASIRDVARVAGVSVTTVSYVLNGKGNIRPSTRARVEQAIAELGYTRSITARNLREQQSRIIGYAAKTRNYGGTHNPLMDEFLHRIVPHIEADGRHLMLFYNEPGATEVYRELWQTRRVDGFILSYTERDDPRFPLLLELGVPFAAFGRSLTPLDDQVHWVDVDGHSGLFQATTHLIQQGHTAIGLLGWPVGSASGDMRYQGYEDALRAAGLTVNPAWVVRTTDRPARNFALAAAQLLGGPNPPTAVVALNDVWAAEAMQFAHANGLRVAVTGYDDAPLGQYTTPTLTSVRQPIAEVARLLADMLTAQLDGTGPGPRGCLLTPELVVRASSQTAR